MESIVIVTRRPAPAEGQIDAHLRALGASEVRVFAALGIVTCRVETPDLAAIAGLDFVAHVRADRSVGIAGEVE